MLPLRLVIDTNVVVSGALKPAGLERATLTFALTPPARLYVCSAILAEHAQVLSRPSLRIPHAEQEALLKLLRNRSYNIEPSRALTVCRDRDDNMFVECADEARADYLITGNKRHFPALWKSTKIINCRELLGAIAPHLRP